MIDNQDKQNKKTVSLVLVRLNMASSLPSEGLTTDPVIHQANEIVEVDAALAKKWITEKYRQCPTKLCERKGGDFLQPEYITRASYI